VLRLSLLAAALLVALVWILRLLARRLIRVLAGLGRLIALSILLTILLLGSFCLSSRLLNGGEHMKPEHTVVRSGKSKRKPFNSNVADYLLIIATFAFSYPLVLSDTSNICMCAFTVVAPGVRFNAFAIFLAPLFALLETLVELGFLPRHSITPCPARGPPR
jgi:hypothetical protein